MTVIGWFKVSEVLPKANAFVLVRYKNSEGKLMISLLVWKMDKDGIWKAPASPQVVMLNPYEWSYFSKAEDR